MVSGSFSFTFCYSQSKEEWSEVEKAIVTLNAYFYYSVRGHFYIGPPQELLNWAEMCVPVEKELKENN